VSGPAAPAPRAGAIVRLRARSRPRLRLRVALAGAAALVALLGGGWLWLRDSSLVAVRQVTIAGVSGRDAAQITAALERSARRMTTLDVQSARLRAAVAHYRQVRSLRVSTSFPHGLEIFVLEQTPVAILDYPGGQVAVDSAGKLLHGSASGPLPRITLAAPPTGRRLRVGDGLEQVQLLAAAPWQLIPRIARVRFQRLHGLVVELRHGPRVYFGGGQDLAAKWAALVAVLADPGSAGASYIDVSDPSHPAAGGTGQASATPATPLAGGGGSAAGAASGAASATTATPPTTTPAGGPVSTTPASTAPAPATPATGTAASPPATTTPASGGAVPGG
jgi:cell division protein FtsQ